jgi:hypothetical protein
MCGVIGLRMHTVCWLERHKSDHSGEWHDDAVHWVSVGGSTIGSLVSMAKDGSASGIVSVSISGAATDANGRTIVV